MYGRGIHTGSVHSLHNFAKTCLLMRTAPWFAGSNMKTRSQPLKTSSYHSSLLRLRHENVWGSNTTSRRRREKCFSSRQLRSLPYHRTIQSLRTFARWYDLIFGRVGVLRHENSPLPLCIDRRWQGRRSAQTPQSQPYFRYCARRAGWSLLGRLTASLSQCELGDYAILDIFRAPVAPCETKGHDIAFHFGEKSLAEFA